VAPGGVLLIHQKFSGVGGESASGVRLRDMRPVDVETYLKNSFIFGEVGDDEIAMLSREAREVRYRKGGTILHRGDPCTGLHLVVAGQVKLSITSSQGIEKIVNGDLKLIQFFPNQRFKTDTPLILTCAA
jgi:CRP-like cAMP-binding protein